jgi:hypothetical protein
MESQMILVLESSLSYLMKSLLGAWCLPFLAFPLFRSSAQTLHVTSATGSPGEQVSVNMSLAWPRGKEPPSTLQWDLTLNAGQLNLHDENPPPGPAAQAAGKAVTCRVKTKTDVAQISTCLVFGGREPIHDGVIAVLQLKIAADAKPGSARIRIDQALAVTKDLKRTPMPATEGVVTIRSK